MLVIGNGESRCDVNIDKIKIPKIGCNALYRDYKVDELVCVDKKMLKEVLSTPYKAKIFTRREWFVNFRLDERVRMLPDLPFEENSRMDYPINWGSGPYAVYLAATKSQDIQMLGFDLYSTNGKFNNVYKDTLNYNQSIKKPVDPSYWIYQMSRIFKHYPLKSFTVYNTSDWEIPESWILDNVTVDTIDKLL